MQIVGAASGFDRRRRRPRRLQMDRGCCLPVSVALDHAASYLALLDGQGCLSMMAPEVRDAVMVLPILLGVCRYAAIRWQPMSGLSCCRQAKRR